MNIFKYNLSTEIWYEIFEFLPFEDSYKYQFINRECREIFLKKYGRYIHI